jgi:hypothetical protein
MKIIITFLLTVAIAGLSFAQQSVEVRLSSGASIPMAGFKEYSGNSIGYAEQGYRGGLEIGYSIHKNWSLVFAVDYGINGTNATKIAEEYLHLNPSYTKAVVESGSFNTLSTLIGIEPKLNLTNKIYLQGLIALGITNVKGPDNSTAISFSSPYVEKISAGSINTFAYQGRLAIKFALSDRFDIGLFGGYFGANPKFSLEDASTKVMSSVQQKMGVLTPGIQIVYKL